MILPNVYLNILLWGEGQAMDYDLDSYPTLVVEAYPIPTKTLMVEAYPICSIPKQPIVIIPSKIVLDSLPKGLYTVKCDTNTWIYGFHSIQEAEEFILTIYPIYPDAFIMVH